MLAESKGGQSWFASRTSANNLNQQLDSTDDDDDDDDDNYEELAAQALRDANATGSLSPTSVRGSEKPWGSRYGSRSVSRRTSRHGSLATTPRPLDSQDVTSYFDQSLANAGAAESPEEDTDPATYSFGGVAGGLVDRILGFSLFHVDEKEEMTEDESEREHVSETAGQAKERMEREARRRKEEKERLVAIKNGAAEDAKKDEGGWADAAYLLSVAAKAMF